MLEDKLDKLIDSVDALTLVIQRLWDHKDEIKGVPAPEISVSNLTANELMGLADPPTSPKDLEELCLKIVRKNKNKAKNIKATIKKFGGELIKDVPSEKLPELQTALEKLAA